MKEIDEINFNKWLMLREAFHQAKTTKSYEELINIGKEIISLAKQAPNIGIMIPLFEKNIGEAYYKINNNSEALLYFKKALDDFEEYRANKKMNKPTDWLKEIEVLRKKIKNLTTAST